MGGFTRVLHSGKPDNLMDEIPTFVVEPLPAGMDRVRIFSFSKFDWFNRVRDLFRTMSKKALCFDPIEFDTSEMLAYYISYFVPLGYRYR